MESPDEPAAGGAPEGAPDAPAAAPGDAPPAPLDTRRLLLITAVALGVRLLWGLIVPVEPTSDCVAYEVLAKNMLAGIGYAFAPGEPTAFWPPGTSAIYAVFFRVFGFSYVPIVLMNAVLGAGTVALVYLLAHRWHGATAATWTAAALALWPEQIQFTTVLASEIPFGFLFVLALALWTCEDRALWARAAVCGVVLAAACFVRGVAQLLPFVFGLALAFQVRERLLPIALASIGCFILMTVIVLPWSLRNERVFGKRVFVSANLGANLWMGNNPDSDGGYMPIPKKWKTSSGISITDRDAAMKAAAIAHIRAEPALFIKRCFKRLWQTHDRETHGVTWNPGLERRPGAWSMKPLKGIATLYWWGALLLAFGGVGLLVRERGWLATLTHPSVLIWGYFAGINAVVVGGDRYHMPSVPMIAILAGLSLSALAARAQARSASAD